MEIFVSSEGTQYKWEKGHENLVNLTEAEIKLLKLKVNLMSDDEILNRESGTGTPMGIPIKLSKERLIGIKDKLVDFLQKGPFIDFEEHAIERIVIDSLLDDDDPKKRGWTNQIEVRDCVFSAKRVTGVRLNIDHNHPENTESVKHLHQQFALVIEGKKENGVGRLVLVILSKDTISIITVL